MLEYLVVYSRGHCNPERSFYQQEPCKTQSGYSDKAICGMWNGVVWILTARRSLNDGLLQYNKKFKPTVLLENIKAKYGTYVNGKQLETALYLYDGDVIRFGALKSYFRYVVHSLSLSLLHLSINIHFDRLRWVPVVVCVSSMGSEDKIKVAERAASLGILYSRPRCDPCN